MIDTLKSRKWLCAGLLILALFLIIVYQVTLPMVQSALFLKEQASILDQDIQNMTDYDPKIILLTEQVTGIQEVLASADAAFGGQSTLSGVVDYFYGVAGNHLIQLSEIRPGQIEQLEFYSYLPLTITFNARYHSVMHFISDVESRGINIVIDQIRLRVLESTAGALAVELELRILGIQ